MIAKNNVLENQLLSYLSYNSHDERIRQIKKAYPENKTEYSWSTSTDYPSPAWSYFTIDNKTNMKENNTK